jgi:flagellar biosynthetic protein FliP
MKRSILISCFCGLLLLPIIGYAAPADPTAPSILAFTATPGVNGAINYNLSIKILLAMTLLTLLPALLMVTTSFTRTIIVLSILRQAIGLANIPTGQVLLGISLLVTLFVMTPVFNQVNEQALQPYLSHTMDESTALLKAEQPFRQFMLKQTRVSDLNLFLKMSGRGHVDTNDDIPMPVLMTAFVTSELKTAFEIGFLLYIPFLIIDLVVASVLMSMGMMMLSPLVISLPFKIMLFVLVDGWDLVLGSLASSFAT